MFSFFFELLEFEFLFALGFAFFFELEGDLLVQNRHVLLIGLVVLHRLSLFAVELDELVFAPQTGVKLLLLEVIFVELRFDLNLMFSRCAYFVLMSTRHDFAEL